MEKSPAKRVLHVLNEMSAILFLFVLLLVIYVVTRYFRCFSRSITLFQRRDRLRTFAEEDPSIVNSKGGLNREIIEALPLFVYRSQSFKQNGLECTVCLSEFQENEKGRVLPSCSHKFHTECIDMWFYSHSTCPLCRTRIQAYPSSKGGKSGIGDQPISSDVAEVERGFLYGHQTIGQTSSNAVQ